MMQTNSPFGANRKKWLWIWLGLEIGAIIGWILWWWLLDRSQQDEAAPGSQLVLAPDAELAPAPPPAQPPARQPTQPDDLTQINGIGPKYAQILTDAGVATFRQLAQQQPAALKAMLRAATGRAPNVAPWIEAAAALRS